MAYDYKLGKKRVLEILNDTNDVRMVKRIPSDQEFTYSNGYYGWVSAIFVDIRNSTRLFAENRKSSTARIIRAFSSEVIEILKDDNNLREIGIRGDCVYAIYASPKEIDDFRLVRKAFCINTFMDMLNTILKQRQMKLLKVGIGLSTSQDLVIKSGRNKSGISAKVWIGKAVTFASKLSSIANKKNINSVIMMTTDFYKNIIKQLCENNPDKDVKTWFTEYIADVIGTCYGCNVVNSEFNEWIKRGMNDE